MRTSLSAPSEARRSRRRVILGATAASVVLVGAVAAGLSSPAYGGAPVLFVERISSALSGIAFGHGAWWVYAFLLGAVAAFNPCGFALVPAYVGLYVSDVATGGDTASRLRRAVVVSGTVAGAFMVLFGVMGAILTFTSGVLVRALPWIGLVIGVLLILAGGLVLGGRTLVLRRPEEAANKLGSRAGGEGLQAYGAFGLAYGLASLGCALPLFLALAGTASAIGGSASAAAAFLLYGAGMATVLSVITLAAALGSDVFARIRGFVRVVSGVGGVLLLISGGYVVYYWLSAGRLLFG